MSNNGLKKLFSTMGFSDQILLEKASEYIRMLQMKSTLAPMTETVKVAVCLDLATAQLGYSFDKEAAIKFSNLGMSAYKNLYNTIEKVLGLDKCISIKELCVQFGIMSVTKSAEELFNKYKESDKLRRDFEHPQYVLVAVYTACQLNHVKVNRTQFQTLSRLKAKQWKELETEFASFADYNGVKPDGKLKGKNKTVNPLTEMLNVSQDDTTRPLKTISNEAETIETYEVWKKRILDEAYDQLKTKKQK